VSVVCCHAVGVLLLTDEGYLAQFKLQTAAPVPITYPAHNCNAGR